jgi:hypothetical protein
MLEFVSGIRTRRAEKPRRSNCRMAQTSPVLKTLLAGKAFAVFQGFSFPLWKRGAFEN